MKRQNNKRCGKSHFIEHINIQVAAYAYVLYLRGTEIPAEPNALYTISIVFALKKNPLIHIVNTRGKGSMQVR